MREVTAILDEARAAAKHYPSADEGRTGLQLRLAGIEDSIKALAQAFDNAFAEAPRER